MNKILIISVLLGIICNLQLPTIGESKGFTDKLNAPFVKITKQVMPSIVHLRVKRKVSNVSVKNIFSSPNKAPDEEERESVGSGVIVSSKGYIVTNNHVIEHAEEITIIFHNNQEYKGELVGADRHSDLAIIKFNTKKTVFKVAKLGDSEKLNVGEIVLALGSPFGLRESVTQGIVSAKGRKNAYGVNFIQTDAAINPGNSGGALVNLKGEVIGINAMIMARSSSPQAVGFQGIGLAIPINLAKDVMKQIIKHGRVIRGFLGIRPANAYKALTKVLKIKRGVMINMVIPDSPADKSGLKPWDTIIKIGKHPINDFDELRSLIADTKVGKQLEITYMRNQKTAKARVKIVDFNSFAKKSIPKKTTTTVKHKPTIDLKDPSLGLELKPLSKEQITIITKRYQLQVSYGIMVTKVKDHSVASKTGIALGDVILEVEGEPIKSPATFYTAVRRYQKDHFFRIRIMNPKNGIMAIIPVKF